MNNRTIGYGEQQSWTSSGLANLNILLQISMIVMLVRMMRIKDDVDDEDDVDDADDEIDEEGDC